MLKLIFKNLWARRRRNGWLFAELLIVSIVTWAILDPVVVLLHDRRIPKGYDADKLCLVTLASLAPGASHYQVEEEDSAAVVNNYLRLVQRAQQYAGVEVATPLLGFCFPNSGGSSNSTYKVDSIKLDILEIGFLPHTHFFEAYGFESCDEDVSASQLSSQDYTPDDIVITANVANTFFGSENVRGRYCFETSGEKDTAYYRVAGVVKNFKMSNTLRPLPVLLQPLFSVNSEDVLSEGRILLRLKQGESMERFMHGFRSWMVKELRAGNLYARSIQSYDDLINEMEYLEGVTNTFRLNIALTIFFLVNLVLGVTGTFWMQTRSRREEVGVMRAFGATPSHIRKVLLGEGAVLTTIAVIFGCFLYFQYAYYEGLYSSNIWVNVVDTGYWVSTFTPHFIIISLLVYFLLLFVVLLGISIPAWLLSKISPTEALRDE